MGNRLGSTFHVYVTYNGVADAYVVDAHVIEPSILGATKYECKVDCYIHCDGLAMMISKI